MAECIKCVDYTKFNGGLCLSCYKADQKETKGVIEKPAKEKEEIDGLMQKFLFLRNHQRLVFF